ncbi:MAG: oligosaccharide flippase family protein [Rhizobium oryzihabitans]
MQILCSSILDIAHNAFSRLAHEPEKLREAYYSSLGLAAATSMPIFFLLSMVSTELIVGFFGTQWKDAGDVLRPLLILGGIQVLQFFNGHGGGGCRFDRLDAVVFQHVLDIHGDQHLVFDK